MAHHEIRLTGSGGQGLILAGIILAEAALYDGLNVVQSQSYGPEARGGASKAEVIISDSEISYPKVDKCDLMLALTQASCDKYIDTLKPKGILIADKSVDNIPKRDDITIYILPILETAQKDLGKPMVSNIVALGGIYEITKLVSRDSLEKAVLRRIPRGTEMLNKKALEEGYNLIKNHKEECYGDGC
ncbi:MAG: 2-oxoacid:acceptor oxidoreductase family protein [Tissierellaceae bacterium]|nr:2-oxoacid:acceptor oxidoreductase family protein [Tissierellaceae bacterium]